MIASIVERPRAKPHFPASFPRFSAFLVLAAPCMLRDSRCQGVQGARCQGASAQGASATGAVPPCEVGMRPNASTPVESNPPACCGTAGAKVSRVHGARVRVPKVRVPRARCHRARSECDRTPRRLSNLFPSPRVRGEGEGEARCGVRGRVRVRCERCSERRLPGPAGGRPTRAASAGDNVRDMRALAPHPYPRRPHAGRGGREKAAEVRAERRDLR